MGVPAGRCTGRARGRISCGSSLWGGRSGEHVLPAWLPASGCPSCPADVGPAKFSCQQRASGWEEERCVHDGGEGEGEVDTPPTPHPVFFCIAANLTKLGCTTCTVGRKQNIRQTSKNPVRWDRKVKGRCSSNLLQETVALWDWSWGGGWILLVLFLVRVQIVRGGEGVMATFPLAVCTWQVLGINVCQSIVKIVERCHSCFLSPCLKEWPLQFLEHQSRHEVRM